MSIRNLTAKRIFLPLGGLAALLAIVYIAHAASLTSITPGNDIFCSISTTNPCTATIGGPLFPPTTFQLSAPAKFTVQSVSTGTPTTVGLTPKSFSGTGTSTTIGNVTWNFDTRATPLSTIVAQQTFADFPADADLYYHVTGTIAAYPGKTFRSITPIHVHAVVNSYNSFVNENFTLVESVGFEDTQNPGTAVFSLTSQNLTLNGTPSGL